MNITINIESLNSSIVIHWDEVDDSLPTTYTVTWTNDRDHITYGATLIEQSSYTITGLTLDTVYTITVTASNKCGTGPEYSTSVSLTTDTTSSNTSAITYIMTTTSATSLITSTAITKSSNITASNAVMNPSTTTTDPITTSSITDLKTSSTNPSAVITSTNTATNNVSPVSTTNTSIVDENSKILSIGICN